MTGLPTILRRPCICREEALPAGDDGLEICGTSRQDAVHFVRSETEMLSGVILMSQLRSPSTLNRTFRRSSQTQGWNSATIGSVYSMNNALAQSSLPSTVK